MKKFYKSLAVVLALIFVLSLAACGNKNGTTEKTADGQKLDVWVVGSHSALNNDKNYLGYFENEETKINPAEIYAKTTFTTEMLCGDYQLDDYDKALKELKKNNEFKSYTMAGKDYNIIPLPSSVFMGKNYINNTFDGFSYGDYEKAEDYDVAVLEFLTDNDKTGTVPCCYEINGNKITFTRLDKEKISDEEIKFTKDSAVFEYEFSICGPDLTLTIDGASVTLRAYCVTKQCDDDLLFSGFSLPDSPLIDKLDAFRTNEASLSYANRRDGTYYNLTAFKYSSDGSVSVKLLDTDTDFSNQYAYILQSSAGFLTSCRVIFLDGEKAYYYTDSIIDREERQLDNADGLTEDQIKNIAEKKSDLFDDLQKEFEANGINVTINRAAGEIAMDSSVLFSGDSADVSAEGKQYINSFLKAYTTIIYNEKYNGFIEKTIVEGHTAPLATSTYESGLPLSTQRAENVKNYILSGESGVDTSKLATALEAVGLSNSKPIYNADGEVDMDASRRVSFRFVVNVEQ